MVRGMIYKLSNIQTGDTYIGQTRSSLNRRFHAHHLKTDFSIIECIEEIYGDTIDDVKARLNLLEKKYIEELKPNQNTSPGGIGHSGNWTDERKKLMSEKLSGDKNPAFGKPKSDEIKKKLSEALKGREISEESRKKRSQTMKGVPKSEETRKKMSESRKGSSMPKGGESKKAIPIFQYSLDGAFLKKFESVVDASNIGCQKSGIVMCAKGRLKTSGGFIWKYTQESESTR
jgi:group I intron endonuclease